MTDTQLIYGCLKNDTQCQNLLYKKYFPLMSSISLRYSSNMEDAKQGLNMAFLALLNSLPKFDTKYPLAPWIKTIFIRYFIDQYRKNKSNLITDSIDFTDESQLPYVENTAMETYDTAYLLDLLNQLPQATKTVFCLYAIDGYAYEEIAEITDSSEATCRWHVSSARQKLKTMLNKNNENKPLTKVQ